MQMLRCGVTLGLLAALSACSNMMGNSSGSRPAAMATQPTVAPEMVRQVQSKLRDDGYYKQGTVDGVWGSGTENAVRTFQHDHNLTSNGQLDVPTLQALNLAGGASATDNSNPPPTQPANSNTPATQPNAPTVDTTVPPSR